ncbi:spore germination protein [Ammoniphilus sp. CFH 90114]|uniref:spore germination protein n=1 Tax=Ammoniphilus sp. CFH 90114 TaxID=2493665 RepID=UPI00100FCD31|nr:spore germination protein [Ammoniphilus sp. CFH 90114]RXT06943.1 spore germination protein [Ammoniphilus sp. CFH 90114]
MSTSSPNTKINQAEINDLLKREFHFRLDENVAMIQKIIRPSVDFHNRELILHEERDLKGICFYTEGLVNTGHIEKILKSLMIFSPQIEGNLLGPHLAEKLKIHLMLNTGVKIISKVQQGVDAILSGDTLLLLDRCEKALVVSTKGWDARAVAEPETEAVVRGPRDGFTEDIRTNTAHVRRRIRDPLLTFDSMVIGTKTKTDINIGYIQGTVKEGLVEEVKKRLQRIEIDAVLESGYIEELIEDAPLSPFPTVLCTERPDKVASVLLEGRVAIFVDNTPFVLIVPTFFWQFIQASDDYYNRYWVGTFFRIIRYIAFLISLVLPSIYVMLVSFHQEMIPTTLAFTIASGREVVPFPVLVEALVMEIAFELMREAGLRMPKPIGSAVSIVGSLVVGQAAVQAGIVSPFMVIVVALTGIASFAIPNYAASFSIRVLRFPLLIASGTLGLLGFAVVFFAIVIHALSIRSFGEPYLAPATPFVPSDQKDIVIRTPWWSMKQRPQLAQGDPQRLGDDQMPSPPKATPGTNNDKTKKSKKTRMWRRD